MAVPQDLLILFIPKKVDQIASTSSGPPNCQITSPKMFPINRKHFIITGRSLSHKCPNRMRADVTMSCFLFGNQLKEFATCLCPCVDAVIRFFFRAWDCWFVCLLINYNVAFDRINVMATINVRQRINAADKYMCRPASSRN